MLRMYAVFDQSEPTIKEYPAPRESESLDFGKIHISGTSLTDFKIYEDNVLIFACTGQDIPCEFDFIGSPGKKITFQLMANGGDSIVSGEGPIAR